MFSRSAPGIVFEDQGLHDLKGSSLTVAVVIRPAY
jgi:hypothetical protein